MKKLHYLSLCLTLVLAFFTSCDNEILEGEFAASDDGSGATNCADASLIVQDAGFVFVNATPENFVSACTAYREALQGILDNCADDLDEAAIEAFQFTLSGLGDCTVDTCSIAETNSATAATAFANATDEEQQELCEAYTATLQAQITACGDVDGSIQTTINGLPCSGCGAAQANTEEALEAFNNADPLNETEYELLCGFYAMALQAQITECGDPDGSLSAIVLDLGDCTPPEDDGPVRLQINGQMKNFNTADVTISGSLLSVVATDLDTGDTFTFDIVLQQTGTNVMQNTELIVDGVLHTPFLGGDTPFTNIITENSGTAITGTFTGTVENPDGDFVMTSDGVISIEY